MNFFIQGVCFERTKIKITLCFCLIEPFAERRFLYITGDIVVFLQYSALHSLRERMEGSFFLGYFHPIQHFSVETIFYIMPKLTLVTEDELVHPELFLVSDTSPWKQNSDHPVVPLYSETDTLRTCTVKEKQKNKSGLL